MSDKAKLAYEACSAAAYEEVRLCGESILNQIREGELTNEEEVRDALMETVDNALIYTNMQYICAWGLPDADDDCADQAQTWDKALGARAFCNLENEVSRMFNSEFEQALENLLADDEEKLSKAP